MNKDGIAYKCLVGPFFEGISVVFRDLNFDTDFTPKTKYRPNNCSLNGVITIRAYNVNLKKNEA